MHLFYQPGNNSQLLGLPPPPSRHFDLYQPRYRYGINSSDGYVLLIYYRPNGKLEPLFHYMVHELRTRHLCIRKGPLTNLEGDGFSSEPALLASLEVRSCALGKQCILTGHTTGIIASTEKTMDTLIGANCLTNIRWLALSLQSYQL